MEPNLSKYLIASKRGAEYLLSSRNDNGLVGSSFILDNYKSPWALISSGYSYEANLLLDAIKINLQVEPGQFHMGDDFYEVLRSSTYRNVFILIASLLNGRFDIINSAAVKNFSGYQHPQLGAFYGEQYFHPAVYLNTNHTGMAGLFCLYSGLTEMAVRAGDFIVNHLIAQPSISTEFYIHTDTFGKLILNDDDENNTWFRIDYTQTSGHYWAFGTGAMFLSKLYLWTGEKKYLDTAKSLIRISQKLRSGYESWPSSGKVAWGAASLYSITHELEYKEIAERICNKCFLEAQQKNGSWGPFFFHMGNAKTGYELSIYELTAEFTLLLAEIGKLLAD